MRQSILLSTSTQNTGFPSILTGKTLGESLPCHWHWDYFETKQRQQHMTCTTITVGVFVLRTMHTRRKASSYSITCRHVGCHLWQEELSLECTSECCFDVRLSCRSCVCVHLIVTRFRRAFPLYVCAWTLEYAAEWRLMCRHANAHTQIVVVRSVSVDFEGWLLTVLFFSLAVSANEFRCRQRV